MITPRRTSLGRDAWESILCGQTPPGWLVWNMHEKGGAEISVFNVLVLGQVETKETES